MEGSSVENFQKLHFFSNFTVLSTFWQIFLLICTIGVNKDIKIYKKYLLLPQLKIWILLYELQ